AGGELADDLLRRVPSSRHLWVLSCHRHDDGDDQTTQLLDHYKGLISVPWQSTGSGVVADSPLITARSLYSLSF
ncbi:MAG: hypothetical protein GY788_01075, partial [bacterium]|nr:hypothetical protein [bacterium]